MTRRLTVRPSTFTRAAVYVRISEDREGRALGVDRQEQDCRDLAARHGYTVVEVYSDNDISASTRSKKVRPRYRQMLADARDGHFEVVIAYTSGRITRKPRESEDLIELAEQLGTRFEYVRSPSFDLNTAAGRRIARIMAATDAGEAEEIQERIVRQREQSAAAGEYRGGPRPFGYESDGVTIRLDEAREVRRMCEEVISGASLRSLIKDLNARGVTTTAGNRWDNVGISRTLRRARNAGLVEHDGEIVAKAVWPAIVPEAVWRRVTSILTDPGRRTQLSSVNRWLGSGLFRCFCGALVRVHLSGGTNRQTHHAYVCTVTKHMTRIVGEVDKLVSQVVVERLSRDDAVDLVAADTGHDPTEAIDRAKDLREELDDLAAAHGRDELTLSQLTIASAFKRKQLAALDQQIATASRTSVLTGLVGAPDVGATWEGLGLDRQRAVINRLFTVELWQSTRGRPRGWKPGESYFDPATVRITPKD